MESTLRAYPFLGLDLVRRGATLASQRASEAGRDPNDPTLRDLQLGMRLAVFETEPLDWLRAAGRLDRELAQLRQQQRPRITTETATAARESIASTPLERGDMSSAPEEADAPPNPGATDLELRMRRADEQWATWRPSSGLRRALKELANRIVRDVDTLVVPPKMSAPTQ